jgi:hypothetical protein
MPANGAVRPLRVALLILGPLLIGALPIFSFIWPAGWNWDATGRSAYPLMVMGVYATLGVFLLRAARDPLESLTLLWFTVWSSVVHAAIMIVLVFVVPGQSGHLLGDVPALLIIAAVLASLVRRATS